MQSLRDAVDEAAERTGFSGVVRLDRDGETQLSTAYGSADRAHGIDNTVETQLANREWDEGLDRTGGHGPGREGDPRPRHDCTILAR